ncbi:leukocyte immunoglobulin-like receptor subfamily A member 6 isoform X2 [Paroedura picta]|uniref:leukocyte immunoglobulin-like receptor subfamily A member 6 isoform X2 n=1 Tax=Paroedura picta TaxID=143630 RepID=UPI004056EE86
MSAFLIMFCCDRLRPPSISVNTSRGIVLGGTATILCHSPKGDGVHFYLKKDGQNVNADSKVDRGIATFSLRSVSREHGRTYACYYNDTNQRQSQHSDPVELLVIDPDLPRPNISLSPGKMAFPGSNITIQCRVKGPSDTFYLHNAGVPIKSVVPDKDVALFYITNVSSDHGGIYSCSYKLRSNFSVLSETSDIVTFLVLDPSLPRPTISFSPSESVALGGRINILCESLDGKANFFLHKDGASAADWPMKSNWDVGQVSINNISWEHQGNYSCSYVFVKRPFVFSVHSDPLELLVSDYTYINIIRFVIGGLILLLLLTIWDCR